MVIIMISVKKSFRKRIRIIIIIGVIFLVLSLAMTKVVYDSVFSRYDTPADIPQALTATVEKRQVCQFPSGDNLLAGYYYSTAQPEQVNGLVVFVPGFHAGGDDYLWQIQELLEFGWDVFTFDPTGTLRSQGESQVGFSQSVLDLEAALQYLRENQQFGHSKLVLMGHSRGAYAACCALSQQQNIAAVVSISGVNSAMDAIMQMSAQSMGFAAYGNYGFLWLYQASLFGSDTLNQNAAKILSDTTTPVLVIHGTRDSQIPADSHSIISHQDEIASSLVEYLLCDAGHTDILYDEDGTASDTLIQSIHEFLLRSIQK